MTQILHSIQKQQTVWAFIFLETALVCYKISYICDIYELTPQTTQSQTQPRSSPKFDCRVTGILTVSHWKVSQWSAVKVLLTKRRPMCSPTI